MTKNQTDAVDAAVELAARRTADAQRRFEEVPPTVPDALPRVVDVEHRAEDLATLADEARTRADDARRAMSAREDESLGNDAHAGSESARQNMNRIDRHAAAIRSQEEMRRDRPKTDADEAEIARELGE